MLVDALREDFVFGPNGRMYMPYTRHVVERGSSNSFVAKARPPTVTMPRIKVRYYSTVPCRPGTMIYSSKTELTHQDVHHVSSYSPH